MDAYNARGDHTPGGKHKCSGVRSTAHTTDAANAEAAKPNLVLTATDTGAQNNASMQHRGHHTGGRADNVI
jgi:hypothetical protein